MTARQRGQVLALSRVAYPGTPGATVDRYALLQLYEFDGGGNTAGTRHMRRMAAATKRGCRK